MKEEYVPLGDLVEIRGGGTPSKANAKFWNGDIPWVSPKDMKVWDIVDAEDHITDAAIADSATNLIPKNATLLVNRSGILKHTLPVGITRRPVAINQDIKALIPGPRVNPDYIARIIKAAEPIVLKWVRATTADNFPIDDLRSLRVPLPPLSEQRRIAAILDKADALRRKRKRALDLIDNLPQSIFLEMFGDPVSNPMGWDTVRLGDVCGVGSSKRVFVSEFVNEGVPFYRGTEIGKLGEGQKINSSLHISEEHYSDLVRQSGTPEYGDLLLPSICDDGRIWKVDTREPFYFKDGRVLWIKCSASSIEGDYLRSLLYYILTRDYNAIASGTTFAELKIVNLKNLSILMPPRSLQFAFSSAISAVRDLRSSADHSQNGFAESFSSIQYRAFSGQL